ncbi:MAG: NADH-quinone oxidoreductase subunit M [Candidatus Marinimicrobia bacterium]|nr:NADH-quinone oxidoreductase subunit M [Candidatus Neomarinimicrobiota bacterium]
MDASILTILVFLPVLGAAAMLFVPRGHDELFRWIAAGFTGVQLLFACWVLWAFDRGSSQFQFEVVAAWIPSFNVNYHMGIDGLSMPMVFLTALLSFISIVASWKITKAPRGYFALFLLLDAGMMGVFVSLDFFLFYMFWEVMLLPMYFLIGIWGGPQRQYAAIKFFLYTLFGSVLMLLAMLALYFYSDPHTFNLITLISQAHKIDVMLWGIEMKWLIWFALFIGFAIKVPIFPFHTWLPLAHVEAPTAVSVILAGVLLKMGTYGLLRISYPLLPDQTIVFAVALAVLGVINIIWGAANAIAQVDLKRMVAYSSVSHMGIVLLGMAAVVSVREGGTMAGAQLGMNGAVLQMFNHGIITAALFLLVGVIYDRAHHRYIVYPSDYKDKALRGKLGFGGLAVGLPIFSGFVALVFFAGLGLPALSGFISEAMCFLGGFSTFRTLTIIGTFGILLNAVYFLRAYQRMFMGSPNERWSGLSDMSPREIGMLAPLVIIIIFLGVYPSPALNVISLTMNNLIELVNAASSLAGM